MINSALIHTALGHEKANVILRGGKLVNVLTDEIYLADVAFKGPRIAYVGDVTHCTGPDTKVLEVSDKYLVPGLIDPHMHPEVCKIPFTRLTQVIVRPNGTTTLFAGMDDYWAVTGMQGVR